MPLVKFTSLNKQPLALEASLILYIGKGKGGLTTAIQTGIQTPQGLMGFEVMETVDEVVGLVAEAKQENLPPPRIPNLLKS